MNDEDPLSDDQERWLDRLWDQETACPDYDKGLAPWPEPTAMPAPGSVRKPGRLTVRLPVHVHRQATEAAARQGMSLNTFIVMAVAQYVGEEMRGWRRL